VPCYHPLAVPVPGQARGQLVPCGQCIGCRLSMSRMWAIRIMCEAQMHVDKSYVTLTYDNDHLPEDNSLQKIHLQKL